jgi:putative chitinase
MLTDNQLQQIMPHLPAKKRQLCLPPLLSALEEFEIKSMLRMAAFLAQVAHESGEFRFFQEIWGPTPAQQGYEGRADLGNTQPGDGFRFRGRGAIQLTGRSNFRTYGQKLGLDLEANPNQAASPDVAFRIAACFWANHGLNALADQSEFVTITKRINGGINGLDDRQRYYARAKLVLSQAEASEIRVLVNGKAVKARAFLRDGRVFAALRPVASAAGLRILEAQAGRAIVQDGSKQNHRLILIMDGGAGFVALNDLPGKSIWNAKRNEATLDTDATRDLEAAPAERGLVEDVLGTVLEGDVLGAVLDLAFGFLTDWFGKDIPPEALSVIRPVLTNFMHSMQNGNLRIDAEIRLEMQAKLDSVLRQAGLLK